MYLRAMPAHKLFFHVTWSTQDRAPMVDAGIRDALEPFIRKTAIREGAEVVAMSFLTTHVHLLLRTSSQVDLSRLLQMLKGGSSYVANRLPGNHHLKWNRRYSITSVNPHNLSVVISYIHNQDLRHPKETIEPRM